MTSIDVHQHLWPEPYIEALLRRTDEPRLRPGDSTAWRMDLLGEPSGPIYHADHDVEARIALLDADGLDRALIAPSCSVGIECLPPDESAELAAAYHEGVLALPDRFGAWAMAPLVEPDPTALDAVLGAGLVGLALPAGALAEQQGWERCAGLLELLVARGRPLLVHPGPAPWRPARPAAGDEPLWWPALTTYVADMAAAWHGYLAWGHAVAPRLVVCFSMLAGLAPLHGERFAARAGHSAVIPAGAFLESSSYGPRAVDATIRALGVDRLLYGSDRPYAEPAVLGMGPAVDAALRSANPPRLFSLEVHA